MSYAQIDCSGVTACGGRPTLLVDGVPTVPLWYALSDIPAANAWNECSQRGIRNFAACGVKIVCVDTNLYEGWREDGTYDPEALYRNMRAVLRANPEARIVTRLHINAPYWWLRRHTEECMTFYRIREDGQGSERVDSTDHGAYGDRVIARGFPAELRASAASAVFLHDVGEVLRQLCEKVKAHPLGEHLIGIQVAYGHAGEWHIWGQYDGGCEGDYSAPMQALFRRHVRETYPTLEQLRTYYGADATFESVTMSPPEQRARYMRSQALLDPVADARIVDTLTVLSRAMADAIVYVCSAIKDAWGEGLLAGAFYAYFFLVGAAYSTHFEPHRVLCHPAVDFVAAPSAYTANKRAGNMNMLRYVAESCRLHGKLFLCEMDQGYDAWDLTLRAAYSCEDEAEYAAILKRNVMENILLGHGAWYYDHRLPSVSIYQKIEYWNHPERLRTISEIQRVCERLLRRPYRKTTDVLVVVDTVSRYYTSADPCPFALLDTIGKCGVGFDRLYLADLPLVDLERYRAVILLQCHVMTEAMYRFIRTRVMCDGRTVVMIGGFASIVERDAHDRYRSDILGEVSSTACVELDRDGVRLRYAPSATVDADLLRRWLKEAGAHMYTERGEAVIADGDLVMVHSKGIPETVLHLPCGDVTIDNGRSNTVIYDTATGQRLL